MRLRDIGVRVGGESRLCDLGVAMSWAMLGLSHANPTVMLTEQCKPARMF